MFFTFPEDARWNADRQAVEFGSGSENTAAWSGSRGACSSACCRSGQSRNGASKPITYNEHGSSDRRPTTSPPVDRRRQRRN